jgi:hypothetical protein
MKCVADKSGWGTEAIISVDQAIAARHTLTSDQLYQTCTMAVDTARQNKEAYYQLGCYL